MGKSPLLKSRVFVLFAGLSVVVAAACSGSKASSPAGGGSGAISGWTFVPPGTFVGGSTASGGVGGAGSGAGGMAAGGGGKSNAAGAGGSAPLTPRPYACNGEVPNQPLITRFDNFMKDRWVSPGNLDGGVYIYPEPLMLKDGDFLRFQDRVETWSGIGVWFAGCINASKYAGVRFTVSGSVPAEQKVWMYAISNRNRDIDEEDGVGACPPLDPDDPWANCRPPGLILPVTQEPTTQFVPWTAFTEGAPTAGTDGSDLLALQWSLDWNETLTPYAGELTIDDLEFVAQGQGGSGGSGGGGSGGGGGVPLGEGGAGGI